MNSTTMMSAFNAVVMAPAASVDAYNSAIDSFIKTQGYSCTALQVIAAFNALRDKTLAYWCGNYTVWLTNDGGATYRTVSGAAQPHTLQARTASDTTPLPQLGPALVVTEQGVTVDGVAIANFTYDDNHLTWSSADNTTSADIYFGTVTRATVNDSFVGSECFGTITYPASPGAARQGTYSLYGRAQTSPADGKSYTLAFVGGALGLLLLLALAGLYRYVNRQRPTDDYLQTGQDKRNEGPDPTDTVRSPGGKSEASVLNKTLLRRRVRAGEKSATELAQFESTMSARQKSLLSSSVTKMRDADTRVRTASASDLADEIVTGSSEVDQSVANMQRIFNSVETQIPAQSRTTIQDATNVSTRIGEDIREVDSAASEDRPIGQLTDDTVIL